jgi:hypothetical protein
VSALLAGCSGGGSNGIPQISSVNPTSTGKLQFAVGTANLYGSATGLNVVSTYRPANGLSNVTVDTPTIKGPITLPAASAAGNFRVDPNTGASIDPYSTLVDGPGSTPDGPSAQEVALREITGTSQFIHPGTPVCDQATPCTEPNAAGGTVTVGPNSSTFGQAGGVFTNGISPGNYTTNGVPISFVPYTEPIYDTSVNAFEPFGGPPAFENSNGNGLGLRDGLSNLGAGVLGIPLGITTFAGVAAGTGAYTLSVVVPTGFSGSTATSATVTASANLTTTTKLGTAVAPVLTLDANGGGTFAVTAFPSGVTEELVQIVDFGDTNSGATLSCQGAIGASEGAGPVYYTFLIKAPGLYTLPDTIGPNTTNNSGVGVITPSPSICTAAQNTAAAGATTAADVYTIQVIGADYPLYESLYPISALQTPALTGANGQADITISAAAGTALISSSSSARMHHVLRGARTLKI